MIKDKSIYFFGLVQNYLQVYTKYRCSEKTIERHKTVLNLFFGYLSDNCSKKYQQISLDDFTKGNIESFINHRKGEKKLNPTSCNVYLSTLKCFASFVMRENKDFTCEALKIKAIRKLREDKNFTVKFFSVKVLDSLIKTQDTKTVKGFRNAFLMLLMFDTGCRLSEITGLRLKDINIEKNHSFLTVIGERLKEKGCSNKFIY